MRSSVWGMNTATHEAETAEPRIIDVRPFVEVDLQMKALGSQMP